jgi:hypothetical protein
MKKIISYTLFLICLVLVTGSSYAQDSTHVDVAQTAQQGTQAVITVLDAFGCKIPTNVAGIIVLVVGFVFRFIEKRRIKQKHADEIKTIIESSPTMREEHRNMFQRIVDRLEGKKTIQQTAKK